MTSVAPEAQPDRSGGSSPTRRNKRIRIAEDARRRSVRACTACRRVKEKCSGQQPCERCLRSGRRCEFSAIEASSAKSSGGMGLGGRNNSSGGGDVTTQDERVRHLESIAVHFLGDVSLDLDSLRQITKRMHGAQASASALSALDLDDFDALTLEDENFTVKTVSRNTAHYSGEFSHWNFSHRVRQKIDQSLGATRAVYWADGEPRSLPLHNAHDGRLATLKAMNIVEYWRATQLQSPAAHVHEVLRCLPPKHIAQFLVQIYFEFAQTNSFYVEEQWAFDKLSLLYDSDPEGGGTGHENVITSSDAAWVCSILMVIAIGTQFVPLSSSQARTGPLGDDDRGEEVGITFYKAATRLLPDIITIASMESVQACLLLAHYTLPLDAHGLAYTYLGLSIKMGIQNGMHRRYTGLELDTWMIETRNRLWWTAYTVERRICVLHGRPPSITVSEVDAEFPKDLPEFRQGKAPAKVFENMSLLIQLTIRLGDIANCIWLLRRCPKASQPNYFERMMNVRQGLQTWWATLPPDVQTPLAGTPMLRHNVHLKLFFDLAHIFTGRPFVFYDASESSPAAAATTPTPTPDGSIPHQAHKSRRATLVLDALEAAFDVVALLKLLHDATGLARASYVEFTSCRAALLLLLAQSVNARTDRLASSVELGLRLIKSMTTGNNASALSDTSVIETIELGVRRLHSQRAGSMTVDSSGVHNGSTADDVISKTGYDRFREWTALWKDVGSAGPGAGGPGEDAGAPVFGPEALAGPVVPGFEFPNVDLAPWPEDAGALGDPMTWTAPLSDDLQTGSFLNLFPNAEAAQVAMMVNMEGGAPPEWHGLG